MNIIFLVRKVCSLSEQSDVKHSVIVSAASHQSIVHHSLSAIKQCRRLSLCMLIAQRDRSTVAPTSDRPSAQRYRPISQIRRYCVTVISTTLPYLSDPSQLQLTSPCLKVACWHSLCFVVYNYTLCRVIQFRCFLHWVLI